MCQRRDKVENHYVMPSGELFESFYKKMQMDYSAAEISALFSCLEMNYNLHAKKGG